MFVWPGLSQERFSTDTVPLRVGLSFAGAFLINYCLPFALICV